ncbi:sensor histidine kinase [Aliikangiella coralliicola]|nr:HAMP domain-containing sensor histidine kinase [Aliikangiella coralliicola]
MNRLSSSKLRLLFLIFFLALAIPSGILSWKAYEQLRWEAFHQYQQDAQLLARQIDNTLSTAIAKEEARTDTDYSFLNLAGDPQAKFVQRSDLSKYPVVSELPGMIGYFQVDEQGKFSTPLLPQETNQSNLYGVSTAERLLRSQLELTVRSILSRNELVTSFAEKNDVNSEPSGINKETLKKELTEHEEADYVSSLAEAAEEIEDASVENVGGNDAEGASIDKFNRSELSQKISQLKAKKKLSNAGFSKLQSMEEQKKISRDLGLGETFDRAQLSSNAQGASSIQPKSLKVASEPSAARQRANRVEQNYIPQQSIDSSLKEISPEDKTLIQINLFESELEPFRFSLLQSGHFVAYRQVWRNKKRIIQGAILSAEKFFEQAFQRHYVQSPLSEVASLNVVYGSSILKSYLGNTEYNSKFSSSREPPMRGKQLFATSLSEPFNQLSLVFRVTQMPTGAGASFVVMVAVSLILVLVLGTYLLYRLTLRQSLLAQQQQDFVSSVSHELKTPLTSIRMYGEILKQGWMDEQKRNEYYDYIYNEAERLSRLIANVLQISKVSRNALSLELKPVKVAELVSLIHSKINSQIEQSEFELEIDIESEVESKSILVDADAFVQIVINLVDNAIKYSSKSELKQVNFSIRAGREHSIVVSVRDFGPGIPKKQINKIFELFYRTGSEMTRENAGTGIGLALVKELANAMNASVKVKNHDVGAEFILRFSASDLGDF